MVFYPYPERMRHKKNLPFVTRPDPPHVVCDEEGRFFPVLGVKGTQRHQVSVRSYKIFYLPSTVDKEAL